MVIHVRILVCVPAKVSHAVMQPCLYDCVWQGCRMRLCSHVRILVCVPAGVSYAFVQPCSYSCIDFLNQFRKSPDVCSV